MPDKSRQLAHTPGETITIKRELAQEAHTQGFIELNRQPGQMRYIVIEPDGTAVYLNPGPAEVDHFQPDALEKLDHAILDDNQPSQTPRPLLRH